MELEDLKQVWSEYDKKLTKNLQTNNEIIRKMNLNNAKSSMDTPRIYEFINVLFGLAFIFYVLTYTIKYSADYRLLVSGVLTIIWFINSMIFSVRLLSSITKVDFYKDSILKIQKQLIKFRKIYFEAKKYGLYTGPILIISLAPIISKALTDIDIFQFPLRYAIYIGISLIIGYPVSIWIYKYWYEDKMIDTDRFIEEITRFEKEE